MRCQKPVLAILNETLLDNHQAELAFQLESEGYHLRALKVSQLDKFLEKELNQFLTANKVPRHAWRSGRPQASLYKVIDEEAGFQQQQHEIIRKKRLA